MKKLISILLLSTGFIFAQSTDDNEVIITQVGDTLKLYVDQIGFGNKIGGDDFSSGSGTAMVITGSGLEFDFDFSGNQNVLFGPFVSDNSYVKLNFAGDSNEIDWNSGYLGSTDDSNINFDVTGSSNTFDIDQGYSVSAERLNADLVMIGSSNVFDIDWEADDITWNLDITGSYNNINTLQNDGADAVLNMTLQGDSADIDINQITGTCATQNVSCVSPTSKITLDVTSDNAIIQINQKDSSSDT